jgi:hypothetical protein
MNPTKTFYLLIPLVTLILCASASRKSDCTSAVAIPSTNEKIWLAPILDRSGITELDIWPKDTAERTTLARHFDQMGSKLLSEFRRCEKFGHYRTVDDSLESTIRVWVILEPCRLRKDTLHARASIRITSPLDDQHWNFAYDISAVAPANGKEGDAFHYAGLLMVDLINSFPYERIVYPFYQSSK